jgi:hypothetical protein
VSPRCSPWITAVLVHIWYMGNSSAAATQRDQTRSLVRCPTISIVRPTVRRTLLVDVARGGVDDLADVVLHDGPSMRGVVERGDLPTGLGDEPQRSPRPLRSASVQISPSKVIDHTSPSRTNRSRLRAARVDTPEMRLDVLDA